MPSRKRQSFCDVTFDPGRSDVAAWHFSGVHTRARRKHAPKGVDRARLTALIGSYWTFVDESIRQGVLDGDGAGRQKLFDELKARGSEMAAELFSKEAQREIWKAAAESDVFVISTNLADVPWEALFSREHGERGSFLSDHCVIQRQLDSSQELAVTAARSTGSTHLVCLDPILAQEEQCASDLIDHLQKSGVGLHHTSTKNALENATRGATVIHWICEHAREGLRLQSDVFYSHRDVDAHRFPSGCVLFMLSCGAGRHEPACAALSAGIAAASGCTVVAPSSVVAAKAAVRFMLDIDEILHLEDVANLSDVWFRLKSPAARRHEATEIAARDCYLLWFGIHGDCDTTVGNMAAVGGINVGSAA
jgi:hypothetical protein